ncbi:MAG: dTDP-4-dehydrorhamnose reductase [Bdellovibrionales bacterium]|nr:dTDP-4-dehydrorhamnose reductase [Bdellovibrionales bacterium]
MKILLFGGSGQLGLEVSKRALDLNFELISPVINELNITDREQVLFLTKKLKPEIIINAAAYTAVDKAEEESELAFSINRDGAGYVAEAAKQIGSRLFHISTDYVYPGTGDKPILETDETDPLSVYGKSKLAGDETVLSTYSEGSLILRISSLHGRYGHNFIHTMLKLFSEKDELKIVSDQVMSPTWAGWLAEVLLDLSRIECKGIVHACCQGEVSWYGFAEEAYKIAEPHLSRSSKLELVPIPAVEYPTPATRPKYSVLDCRKLTGLLGREPIPWQEGLRYHLSELGY